MRVLFIGLVVYETTGGIQTFNKYFIRSLKINNIKTTVVSYHDKNSLNGSISCDSNLLRFVQSIYREGKNCDIIIWGHVNLLPAFLVYYFLNNSKHILITHGTEVWKKLPFIKEIMLNKMDYILSVSNFTKDKLIDIFNIKESKIKVFPNCIDKKNKINNSPPFDKGKFNILTILRVDESYKLQSIINVLDALKDMDDNKIHFTVIGKGNRLEYIQSEINIRGLKNNVTLRGFVEDTAPYLEHCDLFTLISDREGFGIVYLEAMEYSKPCLSAKYCGSSDVIIDGFNGYSFNMKDIETLIKKIKKLKEDKQHRKLLGLNGKKLLDDKFVFNCFVDNQRQILNEIVRVK